MVENKSNTEYYKEVEKEIKDNLLKKEIDPAKQKTILTIGYLGKEENRSLHVRTPKDKALPPVEK